MNENKGKLKVIAGVLQYWLDRQEDDYKNRGILINDKHSLTIPPPPNNIKRGEVKKWVDVLTESSEVDTHATTEER